MELPLSRWNLRFFAKLTAFWVVLRLAVRTGLNRSRAVTTYGLKVTYVTLIQAAEV
jgi:hypothetical protein